MGSFDLTANGGGTVTLVAPSKITIDGRLLQRRSASFATLKLTFVPEPGALLLLGGAALALVLRARGAPPAPEGGSATVPKRRAPLRFGWWG